MLVMTEVEVEIEIGVEPEKEFDTKKGWQKISKPKL